MFKKLLTIIILAIAISISASTANAMSFNDVPSDAWYIKDLENAVNKGMIKGVEENIFSPDENITYAQFITVLIREKFGEQPVFEGEQWYSGYVKKAIDEGIVNPKKDIQGWDNELPRGRMAMFMCRALELAPNENEESMFYDLNYQYRNEFFDYFTKAYKEYLIEGSGYGDGNNFFKKKSDLWSPVTRAQLATIIMRIDRYRNDAAAFKEERSKLRENDINTRKEEYAKTIGLKYKQSSEHFDFYLNDSDEKALPDLVKSLEDNYKRITADLKPNFSEKVRVIIYPDIKTFHLAINQPNAPDWLVGTGGDNQLKMVSPLNPGGVHSYTDLMKTVVHEFTHVAERNINNKESNRILWEGTAAYEAGQFNKSQLKLFIKSGIPTFKQLKTSSTNSFGTMDGYDYSYTIVEFIVNKFGMDKLAELIKKPNDFNAVLGISEDELERQWIQYLKDNYK